MTTDLIPLETVQQIGELDQRSRTYRKAITEAKVSGNDALAAILTAQGVQALRNGLTEDLMRPISDLQGTELGFRTDKDASGDRYPDPVVRDVVIQAMMLGFRLTGNEFNIIAGRFYAAQQGCVRAVQQWPGVSNVHWQPGVPQIKDASALCEGELSFSYDGEPVVLRFRRPLKEGDLDTRIPIRVNRGQGPDAVLGKAKRKAFAAAIEWLTGHTVITRDDQPAEPTVRRGQQLFDNDGMPV
jgi:hypothetical protein